MITALQEWAADRLTKSEPFFGPPRVEVVTDRMGDYLVRMKKALLRGTGLGLVVSVPTIEKERGANFQIRATLSVLVYENVTINMSQKGTRITATAAALHVLLQLGEQAPPDSSWSPLLPATASIADASPEGNVVYEVTFTTSTVIRYAPTT